MKNSTKGNTIISIIVLVVVVVAGYYAFTLIGGRDGLINNGKIVDRKVPPPEINPVFNLSKAEESGDVSAKKAEILSLVGSDKVLTTAQKEEITAIYLTKANIYNFSGSEMQSILKKLEEK